LKKKPTNKDYGRRLYVSDDDYQTAMRRVPDKAVYNEQAMKQSEFKKPYRSDSETYEEMEYNYPNPSIPNYLPPQPNADVKGEIPGTDLYDYGLVHCFGDPCYCKGQTKCFDWWCTYPLVKAWFDDPRMGVSFSGNQICISAPATEVFGSQTLWYDLQLLRVEGKIRKTSISHLYKSVSECDSSLCCGCTGISIGYTTQQMTVNGTQTLTVVGATEGCTYNWAIASGGGSLSSSTGTSVVYTAPATNAECANNPTITLSAGGAQCDLLKIAVNAYTGSLHATSYCCTPSNYPKYNCRQFGHCNGTLEYSADSRCVAGSCFENTTLFNNNCAFLSLPEKVWQDIRTAEMITAGCCPAILL